MAVTNRDVSKATELEVEAQHLYSVSRVNKDKADLLRRKVYYLLHPKEAIKIKSYFGNIPELQ